MSWVNDEENEHRDRTHAFKMFAILPQISAVVLTQSFQACCALANSIEHVAPEIQIVQESLAIVLACGLPHSVNSDEII